MPAAGSIAAVGRFVDVLMAFPLFVLAMAMVAALGNRVENIVIATAIINLPFYIRFARAEVNVRRNVGWVEAARACGDSHISVVLRFLLPNVLPAMAVQMSLNLGWAILNAAGLSFIGLGVKPPTPEWGIMVAEGARFISTGKWWLVAFPGLALDAGGAVFQPARRRGARYSRSPHANMTQSLLRIEDLHVTFSTRRGLVEAVRGVTLSLGEGEMLGLVGESGSGKSVTGFAITRLLDAAGRITAGNIRFRGQDITRISGGDFRASAWRRDGDDLPESARRAQSDPRRRPSDRRCDLGPQADASNASARARRWSCCAPCKFAIPKSGWPLIRTNSPAACASA